MIPELDDLTNSIKSLPGIGPKAAMRIALYLIENKELSSNLTQQISLSIKDLSKCPQCGNISKSGQLCSICLDNKRDRSKIALVSNVTDIIAIEKSNAYNGLYFVFYNLNNLFNKKELFDDDIEKLKNFIKKIKDNYSTNVKEVIFALPYSIDSEVACSVISENINDLKNELLMSRIALGMPSGADFDYTDKLTIIKSFKGRSSLK